MADFSVLKPKPSVQADPNKVKSFQDSFKGGGQPVSLWKILTGK